MHDSFAVEHGLQTLDNRVERFRLAAQLGARGGVLFGAGGGLLGDLVHLVKGTVNLADAFGLFLATGVDLVDQFLDALGDLGDLAHRFGDGIETCSAFGRCGNGLFNESGGVFGGLRAALCEGTDFIGNYGEPEAGLAGAGRFDGGIESKNICLERDLIDDLDDFGDLIAGSSDFAHGSQHFFETAIHLVHACGAFAYQGHGVLRMIDIL